MKKTILIIISLIFTVLVGSGITYYLISKDNFSFSDLYVDISGSNALGVGKINTSTLPQNGKRFQSNQDSSPIFNKLLKVNENGEVEIIWFYNQSDKEVEIPFHPILIENYGDFTYIVYCDWPAEYSVDESSELRQIFWASYGQEAWNRDKLFNYEFVAIHKTSGKVFDLKESVINKHTQSKSLSSTLVYLPDGFAFTTDPSQNNNQVCINRGSFNVLNEVIDVGVVCTDVIAGFSDFNSHATALPNGDIKLIDYNESKNKVLNLYTLEIYDLNNLSLDDPRLAYFSQGVEPYFISSNQFSWILNENSMNYNVSLLYQNSEFSIIEEQMDVLNFNALRNNLYYNRNLFSSSPFINLSISYSEESLEVMIQSVNPQTLAAEEILSFDLLEHEPDINPMNAISLYPHFYQNSLFLIKSGEKPFIYEVDLSIKTFIKIFSSLGRGYLIQERTKNPNFFLFGEEFYFSNGWTTFKRTGNFYFSVIESLTEAKFKFNIYNRQTYQESQSTPTFSYYEITPIN